MKNLSKQLQLFESQPPPFALLESHFSELPCRIRESKRAKYVRLRLSLDNGLEITLPQHFDRNQLYCILEEKRLWIQKSLEELNDKRAQNPIPQVKNRFSLPTAFDFSAVLERWEIRFQNDPNESLLKLQEQVQGEILLSGNLRRTTLARDLLRKWVSKKAGELLVPLARQLSQQTGLPFANARIRAQKTRWASCSSKHNINLNRNLLFLPPELTHYVIIHELCHTQHLNHSKAFWALVSEKEPNYKSLDTALRTANRFVPDWLWD
ncbi:protein of unknown function DUF45 [Chloroherpeton thalassium ATCC 35110]|uniref:YgjP-like metallopeptidase domain-containing protein n=1 Tax=Chloroherpeton thalassium (strain ATCC 35110 / GB-78) TaxID=517418 RepID=B3QY79_CHLT3|nr:SprT family zinc-dependent metalloprotease [Chloroherpeton thalassium]ACF15045.1 protein of unknown function DUF45 [Chloroherpeton thalassium ATCC 35110]